MRGCHIFYLQPRWRIEVTKPRIENFLHSCLNMSKCSDPTKVFPKDDKGSLLGYPRLSQRDGIVSSRRALGAFGEKLGHPRA